MVDRETWTPPEAPARQERRRVPGAMGGSLLLDQPRYAPQRARIQAFVDQPGPLAVEVGFDHGITLLSQARARPGWRWLGLEIRRRRVAAVHPPLDPTRVRVSTPIDVAGRAPGLSEGWRATGDRLRAMLDGPADRFLVVGDTALERDWAEAARAAGFMKAERYFGG